MQYHKNAKTNDHIRRLIRDSDESVRTLAQKLRISKNTVQKWKNAQQIIDLSSSPKTVSRTLTKIEQRIVISVRRHLKLSLDDVVTSLSRYIPKLNRINCYRTLKAHDLSALPKPFREKGKFPKYPPGFIHFDLAYLPFLGGRTVRLYLFVAIDRITKLVFLGIARGKHQFWAIKFLENLVRFFPYPIHRILTDNGKEVNRLFTYACEKKGIKHKKTKIKHPWTNGQVETTIKQIKTDTIWKTYYKNDIELITDLTKWVNAHNLEDKLRSIQHLTPYEKVVEYFQATEKNRLKFRRKPLKENIIICTITL